MWPYPLILNFIGVGAMLHFMWLLLGSTQNVLLLTQGGPGNSSLTLGYYLYEQAFEVQRLGYSQAIGVVIFFIGIAGMFIIRRSTNSVHEF
ncbi:sugar ABC transporter permease [bacterium]|nr:sugar ABC transporter permease [bacterium]